jgi:hypothetical protein
MLKKIRDDKGRLTRKVYRPCAYRLLGVAILLIVAALFSLVRVG